MIREKYSVTSLFRVDDAYTRGFFFQFIIYNRMNNRKWPHQDCSVLLPRAVWWSWNQSMIRTDNPCMQRLRAWHWPRPCFSWDGFHWVAINVPSGPEQEICFVFFNNVLVFGMLSTQLNSKGGRNSPSGIDSTPSLFPQTPINFSTCEYQGATSS